MESQTRITVMPQTTAIFSVSKGDGMTAATRFASLEGHEFLLMVMPVESVEKLFGPVSGILNRSLGLIRRWTPREAEWVRELREPPVAERAIQAWYLAKTLEMVTVHLYQRVEEKAGYFCMQVKSTAHRHVREALRLLEGRLGQALDLGSLATDVGCAPHYLSRLVKQETGKTLSLHLRAMRVGKASELLAGHRFNVTEVALEVGYQSMSHFSRAFAEEMGVTPSQFQKGKRPEGPKKA